MYEVEDISLRHQEISADNYCSAVNGGASPTMDLYFSTSDSFSLQEMLDIDIKNEMDTDINFSFTDIPLLEHEEGSADFTWFSNNSNHSNSNLLEFGSDQVIMVNPNQVLKNPRSLQQKEDLSLNPQLPVPSPSPKQSHLTFSPAAIKLTNIKPDITAVKKDLTENLGTIKSINRACENIITPTIKASLSKPINIITAKTVITKPAQQSFLNNQSIRISTSKSFNSNVNITRVEALTPRHIISNNGISRKVNSKYRNEDENPFPKPTYSYSCLIAMALKNSRTGSLPVSEIYNFMCQHFPYFKTAPNGWKNSVRHNLSLNKCFEKIEKPATSGAQRKGCLWAMHPDKISKMDEEVQKWSRKDPAAIKRAMVYPENLEALERGELKYGSESYGDSCGSGGSDSEGETETEAEEYDGEVSQQEHNITINEDAVSKHDYVEIGSLADSYDEVGDHIYDDIEVVNDQEALRVEVALAQRELFKFEESRVSPSKRFRTSGSMNGETVHFASGGRRKTPLLVRNNSNTSFIEIGVTD